MKMDEKNIERIEVVDNKDGWFKVDLIELSNSLALYAFHFYCS